MLLFVNVIIVNVSSFTAKIEKGTASVYPS